MSFWGDVFLQLRDNVLGRTFRKKLRRPYMMYREQRILEELILNHQPKHILEWGSGYSTLFFPQHLSGSFRWMSLETNPIWCSQLIQENLPDGVHMHLLSEDDIVQFPMDKGPFDLIIIDGVLREESLKICASLLSPMGIVVLHDANRREYHPFFGDFKFKWILLDYRRTAGGFAILSNSVPINSVLNVKMHEKYWKHLRNFISKVLAI